MVRDALAGLRAYRDAPRSTDRQQAPTAARIDGASLRDHGGDGPPAVLIPSLINPPDILDLDDDTSLTAAVRAMSRHVYLVDWGAASQRGSLSVAGHVERLLLPLLDALAEPAALVGYCLGGTMAIAAATLASLEQVVTLAAPWHFSRYPAEGRIALERLWQGSQESVAALGALPMELLQAAFWSLDPDRTVRKFAEFGRLDSAGPSARRFVALEDWANEGQPLPLPAARELIEDLFSRDLSGRGDWLVGGRTMTDTPPIPVLNFTASHDRIAPAATAPRGETVAIPSGHVGMIVGKARGQLHAALARALDPSCR